MEGGSSSEYARLLSTVQSIRERAGGELVVPQICVLGDQGSRKSSWLCSIVPGLKGVLPTGRGTQTRCPTVVRVKPGSSEEIILGPEKRKFQVSEDEAHHRPAREALVALQDALTKVNSGGESEEVPVCDTEVVVEYIGSDVVDLVLVDLPGLIQSGPGVGKVEAMARKYIKQDSTLIVIIREADLDQERAAALKLASEADPRRERTLEVLTKCDSFSKVEGEEEVVRLVAGQPEGYESDTSLAVHLTCCDPEGVIEEDYFREHNFGRYTNLGSRDLALRRLPRLLAQRIEGCKPALLQQIRAKQEEARATLRETGRSSKSNDAICLEFMRHAGEVVNMEEILSPTLARFDDVDITAAWTDERHVPNQFAPSFYQGLSSFERCVRDASEEFIQPRAQQVCNDVAALLESIPDMVLKHYPLAGPGLHRAFSAVWSEKAGSSMKELRRQVLEKVDAESRFATTNDHYLHAEYLRRLFVPDAVARNLARAVEDGHIAQFNYKGELSKLKDEDDRERELKELFESVLDGYFTKLVKAEAEEFQKTKLRAAVEAYWKVTRKRVSDTIMQCVRDVVIRDGWEDFLRGLPGMDTIKSACGEPDDVRKRRERNIELEISMNECLKMAQDL